MKTLMLVLLALLFTGCATLAPPDPGGPMGYSDDDGTAMPGIEGGK